MRAAGPRELNALALSRLLIATRCGGSGEPEWLKISKKQPTRLKA